MANGEVCCGSCETEFNALAALTDEIPGELADQEVRYDDNWEESTRADLPDITEESDDDEELVIGVIDPDDWDDTGDEAADEDEERPEETDAEANSAHVDRLANETWNQDEWQALLDHATTAAPLEAEPETNGRDPALYGEVIVLESGAEDDEPEAEDDYDAGDEDDDDRGEDDAIDDWASEAPETHRDDPNGDDPEESGIVAADPSLDIEREFKRIEDDESAENSEDFHRWLNENIEAGDTVETESSESSRGWSIAAVVLILILLSQLLHYNRDSLAADSRYGGAVRGLYSGLGLTLYPEWELNAFEVRGTEAVAGDSESSALNILANILVVSDQPVGMPMVRVVLHDRWSDPVASGIFQPTDYLGAKPPRPAVLDPGTTLPIKISVADPGNEARGYVVDICLPRRSAGLQCQLSKDPFR